MIFSALSLPLLVISFGLQNNDEQFDGASVEQFDQSNVESFDEAAAEFDDHSFDDLAAFDGDEEADEDHAAKPKGEVKAAEELASWSYSGANGPSKWGDLHPSWEKCKTGKMQSPVDLSAPSTKAEVKENAFVPMWSNVTLAKMKKIPGRTLVIYIPPRNYNSSHLGRDGKRGYPQKITYEGKDYRLQTIRFRTPAGHAVNGTRAPFAMQMRFSVISFLTTGWKRFP